MWVVGVGFVGLKILLPSGWRSCGRFKAQTYVGLGLVRKLSSSGSGLGPCQIQNS